MNEQSLPRMRPDKRDAYYGSENDESSKSSLPFESQHIAVSLPTPEEVKASSFFIKSSKSALHIESDAVGIGLPTAEEEKVASYVIDDIESSESSLPVDNEDVGVSLPTAEEARVLAGLRANGSKPDRVGWGTGEIVCCCIIFILALVLVLGLTLGLTADNCNGSSAIIPAPSPPPDITSAPFPSPDVPLSEMEKLILFMSSNAISSSTALEQTGTPQYEAARWLVEDDEASLSVPEPTATLTDMDVYLFVVRYAMAVMFFSMGGDSWVTSMNFLSPQSVCSWHMPGEAFCDDDGIPRALLLEFSDAIGTLPEEIGALTTLQSLKAYSNPGLGGEIPRSVCRLTNLFELNLRSNTLTGSIPDCIDDLENLEQLLLDNNRLSNTLPTEGLCGLHELKAMKLQYNDLSGTLPSCVDNLESLTSIGLSNNLLDGQFPALNSLSLLSELVIDDNMFSGDISVFNPLRGLRRLYADGNFFSGDLVGFGSDFPSLIGLDLSSNNITSSNGVPPHLFELPKLSMLDLSKNQIQGNLNLPSTPDGLLQWLAVHDNELSGPIPPNIADLESLIHLDLANNLFSGPMPSALGMLQTLSYLYMANNPLQVGPVPSEYENLAFLAEFSVKHTNRNGQLPDFFADLDYLILLDLDDNDFNGDIPVSWGSMSQIQYLLLNRNPRITGPVPSSFGDVTTLRSLFLDGTGVAGGFETVCGLPFWQNASGQLFADCGDGNPFDHCPCTGCICCEAGAGGCSNPQTTNLDLAWEQQFGRASHDFATSTPPTAYPTTHDGFGWRD